MVNDEVIKTLLKKAADVRELAFVPRSEHKIGSCVLTKKGNYYEGCNVENVISGLGTCAERAAIDHAIIHGCYEFQAILTVDEKLIYPCGVCLQYLLQFYQINDLNIDIIIADLNGNLKTSSILELLPHGYLTENSLNKLRTYKDQ